MDAEKMEDYDFSIYEEDDSEHGFILESLAKMERPRVAGLRARFSNGQAELDRLANIMSMASELSIKVAAYTDDKMVLWRYYGVLSEVWESIRNLYGSVINKEMQYIQRRCRHLLQIHADDDIIPRKVHNNLLFWRSWIYRLKQMVNLGFEVEPMSRAGQTRAKSMMVE